MSKISKFENQRKKTNVKEKLLLLSSSLLWMFEKKYTKSFLGQNTSFNSVFFGLLFPLSPFIWLFMSFVHFISLGSLWLKWITHTKKNTFQKKTGEKRQDTPSNSNKKPKDENKTTQEQRKKIIEHDKSD